MKKLLALLLALAVSFSLAIPAFAANTALDGILSSAHCIS